MLLFNNTKKFDSLCDEYRRNKIAIQELEQKQKEVQAAIIDLMDGKEVMESGSNKVTYKTIMQKRFNSAAFRKEHEKMYNEYLKNTSYKRFTIL